VARDVVSTSLLILFGVGLLQPPATNVSHVMSASPSQRSEGSNGQSNQQPQQQASGMGTPTNRRQKSWDLLDQTAIAQARQQKQHTQQQVQHQVSQNIITCPVSYTIMKSKN
jgi:hypothetical protein